MALRSRNTDVVSATDAARERSFRAEFVWYVVLCLVWGSVLIAGVTMAASVSPVFCRPCHGQAVHEQSQSPHASVECDACHVSSQMLGLVSNRLEVVGMVAASPFYLATGRTYVASGVTDNLRCLACHGNLLTTTTVSKGLRMNHRAPQKEGWACSACHRGTAHPTDAYSGSSYTMDMCLGCHSAGPENLSTCEVCHAADTARTSGNNAQTPWEVTHGSNWRSTHGMGDLNTCTSCHAKSYCVACHGVELPHPANFISVHGDTVIANDGNAESCFTCHTADACESCHGMTMPHPDGFVRTHQESLKAEGEAVCGRCHAQSSCNDCHTRHTHPGIPKDQLKLLQQKPVNVQ